MESLKNPNGHPSISDQEKLFLDRRRIRTQVHLLSCHSHCAQTPVLTMGQVETSFMLKLLKKKTRKNRAKTKIFLFPEKNG